MFSRNKPTFVTTVDGNTMEGTIDKIKLKRGLIELIVLNSEGKKTEFKPDEIHHMYLAPSGLDKLTNNLRGC